MVIWSGWGIIAPIILIALIVIGNSILPSSLSDYGFAFSLLVTAAFSWYFGNLWNNKKGKVVIDEETGERHVLKTTHSLFLIKLQHWGLIFGAVGVAVLAQTILGLGDDAIFWTLVLVGAYLVGRSIWNYVNKRKEVTSTTETIESVATNTGTEEVISEAAKAQRRKEREDPSRFMP